MLDTLFDSCRSRFSLPHNCIPTFKDFSSHLLTRLFLEDGHATRMEQVWMLDHVFMLHVSDHRRFSLRSRVFFSSRSIIQFVTPFASRSSNQWDMSSSRNLGILPGARNGMNSLWPRMLDSSLVYLSLRIPSSVSQFLFTPQHILTLLYTFLYLLSSASTSSQWHSLLDTPPSQSRIFSQTTRTSINVNVDEQFP